MNDIMDFARGMLLAIVICRSPLWRHQIETFSALLVLCKGNPPVTGGFPSQSSITLSFDVFLFVFSSAPEQTVKQTIETPVKGSHMPGGSPHKRSAMQNLSASFIVSRSCSSNNRFAMICVRDLVLLAFHICTCGGFEN